MILRLDSLAHFIDPMNFIFENSNLDSSKGDLILVTKDGNIEIIKFE